MVARIEKNLKFITAESLMDKVKALSTLKWQNRVSEGLSEVLTFGLR